MSLHTNINMNPFSPSYLTPYIPPQWVSDYFKNIPENRLHLANLPTPLHGIHRNIEVESDSKQSVSVLNRFHELNINLFIKRDDMTAGVELGGNKIRKLEFLLADALSNNYDSVVTIGGEQSNHCRATAAACRMVGLRPHLILRTKRATQVEEHRKQNDEDSFGYTGNILFDRMVGASIYTCTPGEYGRLGSQELVKRLCQDITDNSEINNKKVYPIPVGGSNGIGTFGYIEGVSEINSQLDRGQTNLHHVVFACGSGGTAAGITLGFALSNIAKNQDVPQLHAVGVCDSPEYFYNEVATIADEMGLDLSTRTDCDSTVAFVKKYLTAHQGKGLGYATSTQEELDFITNFASETGIVLDPVYSGKALYHFVTHELVERPEIYRNTNVLFWHTGGSLGNYDKIDSLSKTLRQLSPVTRLDVYGKK